MGLSVVIPCYNEASRGDFGSRLRALLDYMDCFSGIYEIICVDDGSKDNTADIIRSFDGRLKLLRDSVNHGKGYALRSGIREAKLEYILMMDADLSVPLKYIGEFYSVMRGGVCICGSRRLDSSVVEHEQTLFRRCLGYCSRCCTKVLLGLPIVDTQCGFKMFERERVLGVLSYIMSDRWLFDIELLMYLKADGVYLDERGVCWGTELDSVLVGREALCSSSKELLQILIKGGKNVKAIQGKLG